MLDQRERQRFLFVSEKLLTILVVNFFQDSIITTACQRLLSIVKARSLNLYYLARTSPGLTELDVRAFLRVKFY